MRFILDDMEMWQFLNPVRSEVTISVHCCVISSFNGELLHIRHGLIRCSFVG